MVNDEVNDEGDPETDAMRAGAEVEKGAGEDNGVTHTPRTAPADLPPTSSSDDPAPLTTDPAAQQNDSVVNPSSS